MTPHSFPQTPELPFPTVGCMEFAVGHAGRAQ